MLETTRPGCPYRLPRRQRLRAQEFEGAGDRIAERLGVEADPPPRCLQVVSATVDLAREVILALTRVLEFGLGRALSGLGEVCGFNRQLEPGGIAMANAVLQLPLDVVVDLQGRCPGDHRSG